MKKVCILRILCITSAVCSVACFSQKKTSGISSRFIGHRSFVMNDGSSPSSSSSSELNGAILPMKIAIESGFQVGKSIAWGVLQQDVVPGDVPTEEEQQRLIEQSTKELTNIGSIERDRRRKAGFVGLAFTTLLYAALVITHASSITRMSAIAFPVFLTNGYLKSAQEGL
jgi:hypothetical protein